jgi:hypothetical protein
MTRTTNARVAGFTFLFYIAAGIASMVLSGRATGAGGTAAKLAGIARHAPEMRAALVLTLLCGFCAVVLGVTLYAITRDQDRDLAVLGLTFRVGEGVVGGLAIQRSLALLWLATATGADAPGAESAGALGAFLLAGQSSLIAAAFFAVGSTCFSWLLLRGRMIPAPLAWLGMLASVLLVFGLPLQLGGVLDGSVAQLMWIPMAAFEIPLAFWLLLKGAALPVRAQAA